MMLKKMFVPGASEYVKEVLSFNNLLCRSLSACLNFRDSRSAYFSFLPEGTLTEEVKDFSQGGVFPSPATVKLSEYLWRRLRNEENLVILFDDVMAKPTDDYLNKEKSENIMVNKEEVYHYVNSANATEQKILDLIYQTSVSWHFLAVLFKDNNSQPFQNNLEELRSEFICNNLTEVIVGAYDGEGFIHYLKEKSA
jgi:hypothetical protein